MNAPDPAPTTAPIVVTPRERRRALLGSAVGSTIEWYDYFLYGTMATAVFATYFFPSEDPVVGSLLALASFALAFVVRPLGGIIFSHIGDRIGRKRVFLGGSALVAVFIFPYLAMLASGNVVLAGIAIITSFAIVWPTYGSLIGTVLAENFAPEIRYTGASLGYQIGAAIVGGPAPLIATALLAEFSGSWIPVALFVVVTATVGFVSVSFVKVRHNEELDL